MEYLAGELVIWDWKDLERGRSAVGMFPNGEATAISHLMILKTPSKKKEAQDSLFPRC